MPRQPKSPTPKRQSADAGKRTTVQRTSSRRSRKPRGVGERHDTLAPTGMEQDPIR